jgi:hypothetical protein
MMKNRYQRILFTGAAAIFITVLLCASSSSAAGNPYPADEMAAGPLSVSVETVRVTDQYVEIDAAYPVVSGMRDAAFQARFNRAVREAIQKQITELQSDAKSAYKDAAAKGYVFYPYEFSSAVEKHLNNGKFLSLGIRMEIYTGGAHPFPDSRFYVLQNALPARQLTLPGLFVDPAAGIYAINEMIRRNMAANPGDFFDASTASAGGNSWFYLTDTELHIVFPAYSIAPGAAGEPDFGYKTAEFKDMLIPGIS